MNGKQRSVDLKSVIASVGIGALVVAVVATTLLMLESTLVLSETMNPSVCVVVGLFIHTVSAYVGCLAAGRKAKDAMTIAVIGVLVVSILMHAVLSVLLLDRQVGHLLRVILPEMVGAVLSVLTLSGKGRNRKNKKAMKRYL